LSLAVPEEFKHDFDKTRLKYINYDNDCEGHMKLEIRIFENKFSFNPENNNPDDIPKYHESKGLS